MRPQRTRLFLLLITILTINTLASAFRTFTYWNQFSLQEAIDNGWVTAEMRGIAQDGRFREPMLHISLSKQPIWPFTVVIEQGLRLTTASGESELIVLQREEVPLVLSPSPTMLLAYSLDYHSAFPTHRTDYQINNIEQNEQWLSILNQIISLEAEEELASQLAVWMTAQDVELEEIENTLAADFSAQSERVDEIIKDDSDSPTPRRSKFQLWLIYSTSSTIALALLLIWGPLPAPSQPSLNPLDLKNDENGSDIQPERLFDYLIDWDWETLSQKQGGMAEICIAYDKRSREKVIVKFPRTDIERNGINPHTITERFENERTYHQMMDHENVVKFLESGSCHHPKSGLETEYIILEFIDGKTIHELISDHRYDQVRIDAMIEIVQQITNALTHIHQKEVVHRDITSNNIMVDQRGRVYLIDFGNAAEFDSKKTNKIKLQSVGTRPFYPPRHERVGTFPAYDYYSLAVLLYAMYTGKHVIRRNQERVKEEIRRWYHEHSSEAPMVVRKALAWYLHEKYSDNQEDSEQIREEYFSSARQILAQLVEPQEDEPDESNEPITAEIDRHSNQLDVNDKTKLVKI